MTSAALLTPVARQDRPDAGLPALVGGADRVPAGIFSPSETLSLVARAAETIRTVQDNADLVGVRARELLQLVALERRRMQAEVQDLKRAAADWEEKANEAEIRYQNADLRAWSESVRREEAETREILAVQRAEEAERRCFELEQLFFQIRARLIPALTSAGVV